MKYFVSYVYRDKNGYGFSYSVLERKSKMEDETDIVDIIDVIKKDRNYDSVVIISFQQLGE